MGLSIFKVGWTWLLLFLFSLSAVDSFHLADVLFKDLHASSFTVLRAFRLVRLIRIARLFKLLKDLFMLIKNMMTATRIMFYALLLEGLLMYVFAIFLMELVERGTPGFETVGWSMFWLSRLVTFDG